MKNKIELFLLKNPGYALGKINSNSNQRQTRKMLMNFLQKGVNKISIYDQRNLLQAVFNLFLQILKQHKRSVCDFKL